ncbi:MAG: hypothetical protein ABDH91_09100 [Bacteroidia bacterium]
MKSPFSLACLIALGWTQNVGIGTATPTSARLHVVTPAGAYAAVRGQTSNIQAWVAYQYNIPAVGGTPSVSGGAGFYCEPNTADNIAIFVRAVPNNNLATIGAFSTVPWISVFALTDNTTNNFNPAAIYGQLNVSNATLGNFQSAIRGYHNRTATTGNPGWSVGVEGVGVGQSQDGFGVLGVARTNSTSERAGGSFQAQDMAMNLLSWARVADASGAVRKIIGSGGVSEVIPHPRHGRITLTAPEAPEYWYFDFGTVKMVNGRAHVDLDPILADIIVVNEEYPIRVFVTPVDMPDFKGVTVTNRTATGFDLVELGGGTSTGYLDYQIVVRPKTGYGEGRFPYAAPPLPLKVEEDPARPLTKNRPREQGREIFYWPPDAQVFGYEELYRARMKETLEPTPPKMTPTSWK